MNQENNNKMAAEKAAELLAEMTLEEKVAQLSSASLGDVISDLENFTFDTALAREHIPLGCGYMGRIGGSTDLWPEEMAALMNEIQEYFIKETRLGIPVIFMTEATTGVLSRDHTLFPQNIGAGAMFNEKLVEKMASVIRKEMTATGERMALAPVVDVVRDHRYGRYEESFGEDIYLTAQYGKAYTRGLQSEDLTSGVAATLKHYVAQGISDGGRNCGPIHATDRELLDGYAVPFAAAIEDCEAAALMAAYHEIDQIPCHASKKVLDEMLREDIGFKGLVTSDGGGIKLLKEFQEYCATEEEAAVLALKAGIELELDSMYKKHLVKLVREGRAAEELVDQAAQRMLALKFRLGLFEEPYVKEQGIKERVGSEKNQKVSADMAHQSMTLLKNEDNLLPLTGGEESIAVVGPLADNKKFAYGDYSYPTHFEEVYHKSDELSADEVLARSLFFKRAETSYQDLFHETKTIYEKVDSYTDEKTEIFFAPGLKDTYNYHDDEDFSHIEEAVKTADKAEVIIAVCGDTSGMGPHNDSGESVDRVEITLPLEQRKLLRALKELGKPIILVLCNGRPLELSYESENIDAILEAWKPGQKGAEAICDVLFGAYNPAGRLPVTIPRSLGQLPVYYSRRPSGKKQFWRNTYLEMGLEPLYEFGYGQSYTEFTYREITMDKKEEGITVRLKVENTGAYDGEEVIQLYARKKYTSVLQPERELKAYKRVFIEQGALVELEFELLFSSLCYHNKEQNLALEDCELEVMVGASSEDIKGRESFNLKFPGGAKHFSERTYTNPVQVNRNI